MRAVSCYQGPVAEVDIEWVSPAALRELGWRPSGSREHQTAFDLVEQIVALRAEPASAEPLAVHLRMAGEVFTGLGWLAGARSACAEAVECYRGLAAAWPRRYGVGFADTLRQLRGLLVQQGRYADALPVAEEERTAYQRAAGTDAVKVDAARDAHWWVVELLGRLGRHDDAVIQAEALLARARYLPPNRTGTPKKVVLGRALKDYADRLERVGRAEEALAATEEYVRLVPDGEPIKHGSVMYLLGLRLAAVGRFAEAEQRYRQTVDIVRELDQSSWFNREPLAAALVNLATGLGALGRYREAVTVAGDAVDRYRELVCSCRAWNAAKEAARRAEADDDVDAYYRRNKAWEHGRRSDEKWLRSAELTLCVALTNLGVDLHRVRRLDEALTAVTEAVQIARGHRATDPDTAQPQLATALNNLAILLADLGQPGKAVSAAQESVEILVASDRGTHEPALAMARNTLCTKLLAAQRPDEALAASVEALATYRRLAAGWPSRFDGYLADALTDHAQVRSGRGEHAQALTASAEAVARYRPLAEANPGRYAHEHALAQRVFAEVRLAGRLDLAAARSALADAVFGLSRLAADQPEAHQADLIAAQTLLDQIGRPGRLG